MFSFDPATIIQYILVLPVILLALSIHETCHGYVAYKLGDPTAKNLGRLTLNPMKHIDIFGFICMLFFRFGWAKPVRVNARHFKNPRRDMALTAIAGPISNILMSLLFAILLRLQLFIVETSFAEDFTHALLGGYDIGIGYKMMCVLAYILYMGVLLNISLAVFNLIPVPPFDGSRFFYIFLPQKLYFNVMRYERYIMVVILLLLWFTPLSNLITMATDGLSELIMMIFGITDTSKAGITLYSQIIYLFTALEG